MAIKVLITREFKPERINEAYQLLMQLRSAVTLQEGYISGQTLISADNSNRIVVVSTWGSRKRWEAWKASDERNKFQGKLESFLSAPEKVEVFLTGGQGAD
ncbi:MAG: sugar biosynthesis protein [Deltaproteobacteria bacterium]|nr:sugar biosynthesis protein [Deltaproteobacteria bacterium]